MICKNCKKKLTTTDVYCQNCGIPADNFKSHFSILNLIKQANSNSKAQKSYFYFEIIVPAILILIAIYLANWKVINDNYVFNYCFLNIALVVLIPFMMLPMASLWRSGDRRYVTKYYPQLVFFTFIVALYFAFLKIICQGDPILNLVRLVLILWGLAIVLPVPFLIFLDKSVSAISDRHTSVSKNKLNPITTIKIINKAYIAGKYLRWHQFALCFILVIINSLAAIPLLVLLPTSINFTANVLQLWHQKQEEFLLYNKDRDY